MKLQLIVAVTIAALLLACGGKQSTAPEAPVTSKKAEAKPSEPVKPSDGPHPGLLNPAEARLTAPPKFKARFKTSKGEFVVEVNRDWAPKGVDRFYSLVTIGYFTDIAIFRVIQGFMMQFGIHGNPELNKVWKNATILDDPVTQSNTEGMLTFATRGANTRTTQFFINFGNNVRLDGMGFAPFGKVVEGMTVVNSIYSGYGEGAPRGRGPAQGRMQAEGNTYLKADFPKLDYIESITIEK